MLRLAVLIDGDNITADAMDRLFTKVETLGRPTIKRVYRGHPVSKKWQQAASRHALAFGRQHPQSIGHNATDIEMVIGAMDLLASPDVDGFCLVSSDADFTALATRLREGGKAVYGWGHLAPQCLRNACDRFFIIDPSDTSAGRKKAKMSKKAAPNDHARFEHAVAGIRRAIEKRAEPDGWAKMSIFGTQLKIEIPGFKTKTYGAKSLKKLAIKAQCFELRQTERGDTVMRPRPTH